MMMSMFSSFEALCADSSFGQKKLSFRAKDVPTTSEKEQRKQADPAPPRKDVGGRTAAVAKKKDDQPKRRQRFAPELDGVHCFETIIPY